MTRPNPISELMDVLDALISAHRDLLSVSQDEQSAIVSGEIESVERLSWRKQEIVARLREMEPRRDAAVGAAAVSVGAHKATVSATGDCLDEPEAGEMRRRRDELILLVRSLERVNRVTTRLLLRAIEFADASIRMLKNTSETNPIYAAAGSVQENRQSEAWMDRLA